METYKNTVQVARMFGVGVPSVRRYIRSGELPAARVGRSYVISGEDIDGFVAARKAARPAEVRPAGESRRGKRGSRSGRRS